MDFFDAQDTILWYKYASEGTVVFDKTAIVKFNISNNFIALIKTFLKQIQNTPISIGKSIPNPKSRDFWQILVKKIPMLGVWI